MKRRIDAMLEAMLVDAYGDEAQLSAFAQAFETGARFPFTARVVGVAVDVTGVVYEGNTRRGLVALCRQGGEEHSVTLADVTPGPVTIETSRLLEAYRRWCGVEQLPMTGRHPAPRRGGSMGASPRRRWSSPRRFACVLTACGTRRSSTAASPAKSSTRSSRRSSPPVPRPEFEMEQVIPGVDADDWDADPVADAAELRRAGAARQAARILEDLIAQDERCVDALVHLGNIAFDAKGPKAAIGLYDRAVAIAEQSLPPDFSGVLPWSLIDNRPFLRALHGLGLCAWRQRRWDDAEQIFLNRAWLDGAGTRDAIWCLDRVGARDRWHRE